MKSKEFCSYLLLLVLHFLFLLGFIGLRDLFFLLLFGFLRLVMLLVIFFGKNHLLSLAELVLQNQKQGITGCEGA